MPPTDPRPLPLEGTRILAVSQFGAGPFATSLLADLGADVVKIEDPRAGGDSARRVPPYPIGEDDSLYFQAFNRNKRSVALDLADPRGAAAFARLATRADAAFNNLRGDLPERLGLTHRTLGRANPAIVCASLSGFGRTGPRAAEPGYDNLAQALSGMMALTGDPDGPPVKCGVSVVDFAAGYAAAAALLAGLLEARRTGRGRDVDVSLFGTATHMLSYLAIWCLNEGYDPGRTASSGHPSLVPAQNFTTADGTIAVVCFKEKFWQGLCERIGRPELATDPRFLRFPDRLANKPVLIAILAGTFVTEPTARWLELLRGAVPVAPVRSLGEAMAAPELEAMGALLEVEHPVRGRLREVASPVRFEGSSTPTRPGPALGADTVELLEDCGYGAAEIDELVADGVARTR